MNTSPHIRSIALAMLCIALPAASSAAQLSSSADYAGAAAQERPSWVELALPSNYTAGSVHTLGTSVAFQTSTDVYLWSANTTQWTSVAVSPTAQVTQYNAYVTIEDGSTVHAYATRTGRVETLNLSGTPQVYHGQVSSNWLSIAVLGNDAWAFGSFDGTWHHETLAGPVSNMQISQTSGVFTDGTKVYGVSAYYGDFVQANIPPSATLSVGGDMAAAYTTSQVAGFSSHTNTWDVAAVSNPVPLVVERGYAMFSGGSSLFAFGACTGTWVRQAVAPGYGFIPNRYVAAVIEGNDVLGYSSGLNKFRRKTFTSLPAVMTDDEVLAVSDSSGVSAFSVVTGDFSPTVIGTFAVQTNDCMVWINDGSQGLAYCAVTGKWTPAPVALGSSVTFYVMRNVVVLADLHGYYGFSGRTGKWIGQATTTPYLSTAPSTSDLFVAFDGLQTYIFDPVIVRWAPIHTTSPVQSSDVWRQTFVGFDGSHALGFGLMNNTWGSIPIQGTYQSLDANSSCGFLLTSTHVYAYSAHGSLATWSRFPEFSRLQPIGVPLHLIQVAQPGSTVIAYFSHGPSYQPMPPSGTIFIDQGSVFSHVSLGTVPASGLLDAEVDLSGVLNLRGTAVHIQTIVFPPQGAPRWLANSVTPVLL